MTAIFPSFLLVACAIGTTVPAGPTPIASAGTPAPAATATMPATNAPPTATNPPATATAAPPTPSATAATAAPIPTPTPASTASVPSTAPTPTANARLDEIKIYLIALGDGTTMGPVGCGDEAIAVTRSVQSNGAPLTAALRELLSLKDREYGQSGLYNALYQSNLQVQKVTISGGKATIQLTGQLRLSGECDNPRVAAQLKQTAQQFSTVHDVEILIEGRPLDQVLSLR